MIAVFARGLRGAAGGARVGADARVWLLWPACSRGVQHVLQWESVLAAVPSRAGGEVSGVPTLGPRSAGDDRRVLLTGRRQERDEHGKFGGNVRACSISWCEKDAQHEAGVNTGYMFYLCDDHARAVVQSPPFPGTEVAR
jgi:hypothetical protein